MTAKQENIRKPRTLRREEEKQLILLKALLTT